MKSETGQGGKAFSCWSEDPTIDASHPSIPRVINALYGGKDNYQFDQLLRDRCRALSPYLNFTLWQTKRFASVAAKHVAAQGVSQFVDLGTGLPLDNHDQAPDRAKVAFVDRDPVAAAHGHALLATGPDRLFIEADITNVDFVVDRLQYNGFNTGRPIAAWLTTVLEWMPEEIARQLIEDLAAALAPGSWILISHIASDLSSTTEAVQQAFSENRIGFHPRSLAEVSKLVGGLKHAEPEVVQVQQYWTSDNIDAFAYGTLVQL